MQSLNDTIVALATPHGMGSIGVIRISGENAIAIANRFFKEKDLTQQATHTAHFGTFTNEENQVIDEVVMTIFKNPKSYTGENVVEISTHGSGYILQQVLQVLLNAGTRLAEAGEFTKRAFVNGKMDLAQAEAVADLIAAENKASHEVALHQMRGGVSSALQLLRDQLIHFTALIELELDFAEEDVEFANRESLQELVTTIEQKIQELIDSFAYGNAIKNGVPVAIIGKPNAGKSTLLNTLLKEERAIVSNIAGTTRDAIEETLTLQGIQFRFIDTAGIRETQDSIEAIGVERAKQKLKAATIVIHLYEDDPSLLENLNEELKGKIVFNLHSKIDQQAEDNDNENVLLQKRFPDFHHFGFSAKTGWNMERLIQELVQRFKETHTTDAVIITNQRHKEALQKAYAAIQEVKQGMNAGLSGDLLSFHLKEVLHHLGTITGKIDVDKDILGTIFGKFCIGK